MLGSLCALALALYPIEVAIERRTGERLTPIVVTAVPADNGVTEPVEVAVEGSRATLWLPRNSGWRFSCRDERAWCPTIELSAGLQTATLPVFAATAWRARLSPPAGYRLPQQAILQGWIRTGSSPLSYRQTLSVAPDGAVTARLPATTLDLRLAVAGFAPAYRWKLDPSATAGAQERVRLVPGGSVSGVVVAPKTRLPFAAARVRLSPGGVPSGDEGSEDPATMFEASTDERGFFQIVGLAPGAYRLRVGAADPRGIEIAIEADEETFLPALPLFQGLRLQVAVQPAHDPAGRPWRVEVESASVWREGVAQDGHLVFSDLPAGIARISVIGESVGRVGYREEEIEADHEIALELALVRVEGEVTLGGEPLPAQISLRTGENDRVQVSADETGNFSAWMPEPRHGWVDARVSSRSPQVDRVMRLSDVTVRDGRLELRLDLPDSGVFGTVVDEAGKPVGGAWVSIRPVDGSNGGSNTTDEDGRFGTRGLDAVPHVVVAGARDGRASDKVTVDLAAGDVEGLRLVLLGGEEREGLLLSAEGLPVGGALVRMRPLGYPASWVDVSTELDGTFRFRARREATRLSIRVMAPSQLLWTGCIPLADDRRLVVRLPSRPGGELVLQLDHFPDAPGDWVVVSGSGGSLDLATWLVWERSTHGTTRTQPIEDKLRFRLPRVAAGPYALVWAQDFGALVSAACDGIRGADWKLLTPGGRLELGTPRPPPDRDRQPSGRPGP